MIILNVKRKLYLFLLLLYITFLGFVEDKEEE
jgi:hypothetical protein